MGCVRPLREVDPDGVPTLSPKKRLRFRRKQKGNKNRRAEEEKQSRTHEDDQEGQESSERRGMTTESHLSPFRTDPHSSALYPGSVGALLGSGRLEATPSPAWRGIFCLPGEEDTVSAIVDVSSIPSQTTATTPVNAAPAVGCTTTPGGGRVCRVREKVQGVLEKPRIQKRVEEEKVKANKVAAGRPAVSEHKGVAHIREVDGKLCVVRTVYPSDLGSPLQKHHDEVEVHKEPPAPSPVAGDVLKVRLLEDCSETRTSSSRLQDATQAFKLDAHGPSSLLESGYSSDLPLTSPGTAGTTPSQTDWGGLTSSSSEKLDSTLESLLAPREQPPSKLLPQVCVFTE